MSAINLYTTKSEALYFKDSQRNSFYEFGGIQLLPYNYYLQPYAYSNTITKVESFRLRDNVLLNDLSLYIQATVGYGIKFSLNTVMPYDYGNELIYLRLTHSGGYLYSNPFYYTSLDEDKTTNFTYKKLASNQYEVIGLKTWFRQKSKQTELTTYYESSTGRTVTQAIKTKSLEMYESEFMSMDDLIMTAKILESPYLYIGSKKYYLFESVKIPELTQQENFGKIKFTLATNDYTTPIVTEVIIGTQIWTNRNLDVETYRDGTPIPEVTDPTAWAALTTGAWCYYANNTANGVIYGKLYNWYAVNDVRGLAPLGYHVPTNAEWTTLTTYLGTNAGGKMKATGTEFWVSPNAGATNESGFTGLGGGFRNNIGSFANFRGLNYWWSSIELNTTFAFGRYLNASNGNVGSSYYYKESGFSVRLIKD